jgi:hypothetical protein
MLLDTILERVQAIMEKVVWQQHANGTITKKTICPKGQKKNDDMCVPMNSQELRTSKKRMIKRSFTYDLKPMILSRAAKKRKKAMRLKF